MIQGRTWRVKQRGEVLTGREVGSGGRQTRWKKEKNGWEEVRKGRCEVGWRRRDNGGREKTVGWWREG